MHDTEISKVLTAIEKQSNYRFLYNSRLQDMGRKVTITVREAGIDEVLNRVFSGSSLTYRKLENNLIAIRSTNVDEQDIRVTGRVTGSNGEPLQGVSITLKGTVRGTTTNQNGEYALTVPEDGTLVISFVGFITQEVAVNNQAVINISLVQSPQQL